MISEKLQLEFDGGSSLEFDLKNTVEVATELSNEPKADFVRIKDQPPLYAKIEWRTADQLSIGTMLLLRTRTIAGPPISFTERSIKTVKKINHA